MSRGERSVVTAVAAGLPALCVFGLALRSGGYPPGAAAAAAALLMLMLAARLLLAPATVRRFSGPALIVAGGLAALALLSLASAAWSDAPARAVTAASREVLYLAAFATVATLPGPALAPVARGLLVAIVTIVAIALATRLLPGAFPLSADDTSQRLAFPLSYQNALGLLVGIGLLLALHLTSDRGEPPRLRVAAAAAVPALVSALYLTQSRGAIGATAAGLVVWLVIGRSRWMLSALGAVALPSLAALAATYAAVELVRATPGPALAAQGRAVAAVLVACTLLAGWLRIVTDRRAGRIAALELRITARAAALVLAGVALLAVAAGGIAVAEHVGGSSPMTADPRSRLVQTTSNGRMELWRGAGELFERAPLLGGGADTFQTGWERVRPNRAEATEAHSLYFETLAELGVVGLLAVVVTLAGLVGCGFGAAGPRTARALVVAVAAAWIVHAAVDWDWEMPAVTVALFALTGAARAGMSVRRDPPSRRRATALAALLVLVAAPPSAWALSQARSDRAIAAYEAGDCETALDDAAGALALAPFRPEAYFVRGACLARDGRVGEALAAADDGARADPDDARGAYDAAAIYSAVNRDGRSASQQAVEDDPLGSFSTWLLFWLDPARKSPSTLVARRAPLLLAGDAYPPVLSREEDGR